MKGLTRGERQADLHFSKVSDMPCYTGHSNPGIHYLNANHLNGLWESSNCTSWEVPHSIPLLSESVVQASEATACCCPWKTGPPPRCQLHLQQMTLMATRVVTECITQKLLPIPALTPMASLHQDRVQSAHPASRPCLTLPFSPALLTKLQPQEPPCFCLECHTQPQELCTALPLAWSILPLLLTALVPSNPSGLSFITSTKRSSLIQVSHSLILYLKPVNFPLSSFDNL